MVNPNLTLMEHTLKSSFNVIVTLVNQYGEEHEFNFKKRYKDFMRENYSGMNRVVLVDNYPPTPMEINIYYIKRNGKTLWVKMNERDFGKN